MRLYRCIVCGYVYDPALGDPVGGVAAGTPFEELPADWVCPICGFGKEKFVPFSKEGTPAKPAAGRDDGNRRPEEPRSQEETMSEKTVLNTAAQTERDGRAFYLQAAAEASNRLAREMFEALAAEEAKHLEYIEALMAKRKVEHVPSTLQAHIKTLFTAAPEALRAKVKATETDRKAVAFALDIERKSYDFYMKWKDQADSESVRELCRELAEQENFHYRLFNQMREYLDRTGDWFMREEHWIFDGG